MARPIVIGITGAARAGKSCAAELLAAYTGGEHYMMAGPL